MIAALTACGGETADTGSPTTGTTSETQTGTGTSSAPPSTLTPPPATASLALSGSQYSVTQSAGTVTISVKRTGGSSGMASVKYATSNGTAKAGTNYVAQSGKLSWASGDTANKTFSVPIRSTAVSS